MTPHDERVDDALPGEAAAAPAEPAPEPADAPGRDGDPTATATAKPSTPPPSDGPAGDDVAPVADQDRAADGVAADLPGATDGTDDQDQPEDAAPLTAPPLPTAEPAGSAEPDLSVPGGPPDRTSTATAPTPADPSPAVGDAERVAEPSAGKVAAAAVRAPEAPMAAEDAGTLPPPAPDGSAPDAPTPEPSDAGQSVPDGLEAAVEQAAAEPSAAGPSAPERLAPEELAPQELAPDETAPVVPAPAAPAPDEPAPVEPAPVEPAPVEPAPVADVAAPAGDATAGKPDAAEERPEPAAWTDAAPPADRSSADLMPTAEPAPRERTAPVEPAPWAGGESSVGPTPWADPAPSDPAPAWDPAWEGAPTWEPAPTWNPASAWDPAPTWGPAETADAPPSAPEHEQPGESVDPGRPEPVAPVPVRRPRPGPTAAADPPVPAATPLADGPAEPGLRPSPRPRAASPAATPRSATRTSRAGQHTGRPPRGASAAGPARRRRRWPVLLAAVLSVALLAAGALWFLDRRSGAGGAVTAEQVPDAVLPELAQPDPALTELSADAPVPSPAVLDAVLGPLLATPALGTGLSAQVVDVATGDVLFDRSADDPGTPASTTKLLTALATLTSLDPESTLTTRVVAGSAPGEVVLVGGGDPTLSTTDPSLAYPGAATVAELAARVQEQLAGTPVSRVVVDGSLFSGPLTAPGWGPDDAPSTYAAPVTATAVDGARIDPNGLQRSAQPGTDAGAALAAALGVPTAEVVLGAAPVGATELGSVESASVQRLVEQSLTQSDNLLSESLARHVALARGLPATFAGGAQAVSEAVAEAGLDPTGLSLVDASGLSGQDRAPARLLVDVVRAVSDGTLPEAAGLLSGLPVAGYTGTLAERTADGAGPGAVRAKTGTLLAVHDLAGTVVTADGRLLAFAVLADATAGTPLASETALDVVAAALAACGCR